VSDRWSCKGMGPVGRDTCRVGGASASVGVTGLGLVGRGRGTVNQKPLAGLSIASSIDEKTSRVRGRVARWLVLLQPC
jgi:hypothetical protein